MIAFDTATGFLHTLARARQIALTAYTLREGRVLDALVAAARRGAAVRVRLERDPLDDAAGTLHAANTAAIGRLRSAGASAETTKPGEPVLHLKGAVTDCVAWLDDRNWAAGGPQRILRDTDADDVAAIASALDGGAGADGHLATTKSGAQRLEADVIGRAGPAPLAVESESFGPGTIYNALLHRAEAHFPTRLIVAGREVAEAGNRRERVLLTHLAALGVDVRVGDPKAGDLDEKLAVAGADAWVGSANATYAYGADGAQRDWGMATREPAVVDGVRASFERNWDAARSLAEVAR
jgi:hypothetical protein